MPIEKITLSVPQNLAERARGDEQCAPGSDAKGGRGARMSEITGAYLNAVRARDRFALTNKGRMRNRERFNQSLKAVVKNVATDASCAVEDRSARLEIRIQIYANVMQLAKAMSKDQLDIIMRARTRFRWTLAVAAVGLLGIASTLVVNGTIKWPLY